MPRALLLSPDDQAVSAITGVLEEMSVTCERPLDGASAAQKLNSHSFDLVLVDCENLPAAKLIFDVCRRGNNGNNPVPIAIVDGRAGLPTAFRLGAELILTKPVAKDQARTTIRTAVSRVRKDVPANETAPAQSASPAMPSAVTTSVAALGTVMPSAVKTEEHALAAAASSQLTSFADPAPVAAPTAVPVAAPTAAPTATLSARPLTTKMRSAVDEDETVAQPTAPKLDPPSTPSLAPPPSLPKSPSAPAVAADSKPARPAKPSEDPVLAELEESELKSSRPDKSVPHQNTAESAAPVFSSYQQPQPKRRGPLVALLVLVLAGAAFYAAWTYQPGFRAVVQPQLARLQIDRVLALVGIASPRQSPPRRRIPRRLRFSRLQPQALRQPRNPPPIRPRTIIGLSFRSSFNRNVSRCNSCPARSGLRHGSCDCPLLRPPPNLHLSSPSLRPPSPPTARKTPPLPLIRRPTARGEQRDYSLVQGRGKAAGS